MIFYQTEIFQDTSWKQSDGIIMNREQFISFIGIGYTPDGKINKRTAYSGISPSA